MSQTTLAELSISLGHVQSLLKQITAEVKVLSDGIAVLVEQEEAEDLEEELNYLDVDPWSNVRDKDKNAATGSRRDSIRSLMQRRPSTVKDETKALARILSQKRPGGGGGGGGTGSGSESELIPQMPSRQLPTDSRYSSSNLQDHVIDEDYASSEGSSSYHGGKRDSPVEAERVPHTIMVQSTQMPTKFPISITKPAAPQSPSISSQNSIHGSINGNTTSGSSSFWRSSSSPNVIEGSRPNSVASNINMDGYLNRTGVNAESRHNSDNQAALQGSVRDRYTVSGPPDFELNGMDSILTPHLSLLITIQQAIRSSSQGTVTHAPLNKDSNKSTFTIKSPTPMIASQVDNKMESADCFSKLGLTPELLRGIYAYGLKMPSILQQRGIPMIMTRHDVLTQAKPEVAKTLTYTIPLLNLLTLPATSIHPQLLILCSNHDLCLHLQRVLLALARFMPTISCLICAEGNNATLSLGTMSTTQVNTAGSSRANRFGQNGYGSARDIPNAEPPLPVIAAHVVIGTPGKVLNLIRTNQISLEALKVMVLENADILLSSPLKEATVSLLSMVRDPAASAAAGNTINTVGPTGVSGTGADALISPPNSGPTSPDSKAVVTLNEKTINANPSSETRPRSISAASGSSLSSSTLLAGTTTPPSTTNQPQLLFFSTEVPSHVLDYVAQYMTQPTKALVKGHELALKGILQFFKYMAVEGDDWQLELLCELLEDSGANRTVVFCNKDKSVERVAAKIRERKGFAVGVYSDMDMTTRKAAVGRFRGSATPANLVLTDEAAKDLDIVAVPLVVSFEIPSVNNYIPRVKWIDRSKGKVGAKVTLVDGHKGEGHALRAIQQHYRTTIDDMPVNIAEFIVN
ncbi:translation initiation factor eIF4A [Modicella reniformis]|uniref:ATP-dependent RNA helicase n=1 Tax=Modicella reniformis TaxID=1440133 RepID=A0A9P6SQB6_9FUNG|nr:translation initiation factor eIF4A [Modicella reniformis]